MSFFHWTNKIHVATNGWGVTIQIVSIRCKIQKLKLSSVKFKHSQTLKVCFAIYSEMNSIIVNSQRYSRKTINLHNYTLAIVSHF